LHTAPVWRRAAFSCTVQLSHFQPGPQVTPPPLPPREVRKVWYVLAVSSGQEGHFVA
jgi:hypothetical protein